MGAQRGRRWGRGDELGPLLHLLRWIVLGSISGVLAGLSSWLFLEGLDRVTSFRLDHGWLIWLLPVAGLAVGASTRYLAGASARGSALLIEQIHAPTTWVPRRMAPLVLGGTWLTHLVGGSAGREGTALQLSGSLTDLAARSLRLGPTDRRLLLVTALGGGFGAVFGVPLAGTVFALEVQSIGQVRYEALVPALTAGLVGDLVVGGLGHHHPLRPQLDVPLDGGVLARVALAGLVFGVVSALFVEAVHGVRRGLARVVRWPVLRPAVGGAVVLALAGLFGRSSLGLSLPLVDRALAGDHVASTAFLLKLAFTAVTLGAGFPGGEVTPLFVIGATLGAALAGPLHLQPAVLAAVGFVAVFAGAANTPLACTIMGVELFGAGGVLPLAVGCVVAYVCSSHRGIYDTQRIEVAKGSAAITGSPSLDAWRQRRRARRGRPDDVGGHGRG